MTSVKYYVNMFIFFFFRPAPKNEDEMMVLIFEYIDRIFSVVRPRRLLYMAIDGVVSRNLFSRAAEKGHLMFVCVWISVIF